MNPIKIKFLPLTFFLSLVGMAFSAYNVFSPSETSCIMSSSCELFVDFSVLGVSLWWFGIIFFSLTIIFSLFGLVKLGKFVSATGVILDLCLLCVMLISVPCSNCIIVGALIVLVYIAFHWDSRNKKIPTKMPRPFLIFPWVCALLMVLGNIFTLYAEPWAVTGNQNSSIRVYFSTDCSACAKLIDAQGNNPDILWFPVQEGENDAFEVKYLQAQLQAGLSLKQAFQKLKSENPEPSLYDVFSIDHWDIQLQLWKNSAHVMKSGKNVLPLVEFHGLPSNLLPQGAENINNGAMNSPNSMQVIDEILGNVVGACGDETVEPCPE